ncbi:hypothetical protein ACFL21_00405, partial [Patescibacteria group bacterium]
MPLQLSEKLNQRNSQAKGAELPSGIPALEIVAQIRIEVLFLNLLLITAREKAKETILDILYLNPRNYLEAEKLMMQFGITGYELLESQEAQAVTKKALGKIIFYMHINDAKRF